MNFRWLAKFQISIFQYQLMLKVQLCFLSKIFYILNQLENIILTVYKKPQFRVSFEVQFYSLLFKENKAFFRPRIYIIKRQVAYGDIRAIHIPFMHLCCQRYYIYSGKWLNLMMIVGYSYKAFLWFMRIARFKFVSLFQLLKLTRCTSKKERRYIATKTY